MAEEATGNGFSLAIAGKKQRKVELQQRDEGVRKEEVVGFGAAGLETAEPQAPAAGPKIIAKQENTYRSGAAKFRPSYIPEAADAVDGAGIDKFETAAHDTAVAQHEVTYGLIQRQRPAGPAANGKAATLDREAEVLKADLAELPPEASLEAYEAMPVEAFGEALMRGMGWTEGRAVGRNAKEEVQAKELVRRPQRLGLGAAPAPELPKKKIARPGEAKEGKDLVYVDPSGVERASKPVGAQLTERRKEGVHPGKRMRVAGGRHGGLQCEVLSLEPSKEGRSERARVRLLPSHESVSVRCSELEEAGSEESRRRKGGREENRPREERGEGGGSGEGHGKRQRQRQEEEQRQRSEPAESPWLVPNIRVKVVDKSVGGGRLYLKKGSVVDVKAPTLCDVHFDSLGESCLDLRQSQLETVVPSAEGAPVLVLRGELRGRRGRLLRRSATSGAAAVQLTADLSVHKLPLDDIAEYCGPTDTWDE